MIHDSLNFDRWLVPTYDAQMAWYYTGTRLWDITNTHLRIHVWHMTSTHCPWLNIIGDAKWTDTWGWVIVRYDASTLSFDSDTQLYKKHSFMAGTQLWYVTGIFYDTWLALSYDIHQWHSLTHCPKIHENTDDMTIVVSRVPKAPWSA